MGNLTRPEPALGGSSREGVDPASKADRVSGCLDVVEVADGRGALDRRGLDKRCGASNLAWELPRKPLASPLFVQL